MHVCIPSLYDQLFVFLKHNSFREIILFWKGFIVDRSRQEEIQFLKDKIKGLID